MTHNTIGGSEGWRDTLLSNPKRNLFIGRLLWGAGSKCRLCTEYFFLSADNSKSRRCLEFTLMVVVVKYVVEL
jgi:hypothetical protein